MATVSNISEAIRQNDIINVEQLLKNGTNPNKQYSDGRTPLHLASNFYKTEIIGSDLHLASNYINFKIVKLLLEHGADPNIQNDKGWTPLTIASFLNKRDIIMILIDYGANYDLINNNGKTSFDYAGGNFIKEYLESKEHQIVLK